MTTTEIATHDRNMWWHAAVGDKRVRDLSTDHIRAIIENLEWLLRRNAPYPATHPRRKHESTRRYQLKVMKAELEWRTRNGQT